MILVLGLQAGVDLICPMIEYPFDASWFTLIILPSSVYAWSVKRRDVAMLPNLGQGKL